MTELRSVDPRDLKPNPNNPRMIQAQPGLDEQLVASIRAIGIIQPPVVRDIDGTLVITAGHRRVQAAISAGLPLINVLVASGDDTAAAMESLSENLVRVSMNNVDIWRGIERLEAQGWNEQAIADALTQPLRTVRRLKLLSHLHPPMLEALARGDMPREEQLRIIANASIEEQAQVWKKHKPKKSEMTNWFGIAHALTKRRIPFSAAKFDDALATKYGVIWHEDLFASAGEDSRYTTDVDAFFGAQQEWLENNLPKGGVLIPQDQHGRPTLPKNAQHVYGKPAKGDVIGHYLDPRTAEVETVIYRLPPEKKSAPAKGKVGAEETPAPALASRPDVTQRGKAMIGDFRTDALHEALRLDPASDTALLAFLVLAFAGRNVSVESGVGDGREGRTSIAEHLIEGGVLSQDEDAIRQAAREMLVQTLSCRDNSSDSGIVARIAGNTIGAALRLPSMATDEFLSCLSRRALEREAAANAVRVETRVRDTRAGMVSHFNGATWHYPDAVFALKPQEIADARTSRRHAWVRPASQDAGDEPEHSETIEGAAEDSEDFSVEEDAIEFADAAD